MSSVDSDVVLITVFDERTTLGLVKFYSARVVKRIAVVITTSAPPPSKHPSSPSRT
jgi:hypothetical protein